MQGMGYTNYGTKNLVKSLHALVYTMTYTYVVVYLTYPPLG